MVNQVHELIARQAALRPDSPALFHRDERWSYARLWQASEKFAAALLCAGVGPGERVATYLPKQPELVVALMGASAAGAVFVPVNPLLKPRQVGYILGDCDVTVLVTSAARLKLLADVLAQCPSLTRVVVVDEQPPAELTLGLGVQAWGEFCGQAASCAPHRRIDVDMAAILYTSGSTGQPKGVVLSHRNIVAGAESVASYLENTEEDRVLAILPLSFDAGFSQLTTMFHVGGSAVLMDYLLPADVLQALERYQVTGLAGVPPIWNQLVGLEWPPAVVENLRYITNTGGAMPTATTRGLVDALPGTKVFLMYGLTEAFRSTYLPPEQVSVRPDSIGKAIPNAEILVINERGEECGPDEPGELVHRGALVAMGYWNAPERTAERFRPLPNRGDELTIPELAVWSGDRVRKDGEGYLYFVSREDEMIKTSGYRVSPTEVEEVIYAAGGVAQVAAFGVPHPMLGQAIVVVVSPAQGADEGELDRRLVQYCRRELPNFMVPQAVLVSRDMPLNQNGKLDRKALANQHTAYFQEGK
ncbi:acyl-CoA ligase (AMP-forming), exosortase A system-associated [Parahaliea mediterranea]|uniref:Acyl-CoA ligase (AMP-forming), exosortase A system-associated n=1 Tax=Parahaliea mediterranea TaxID=651086 RepID=A0A939DFW0_9GAMM|nr:acyl-CoA ligase (AMP-forming), exosortase A system-associated [Parahaliea mediterranea]MBN7797421.1 acyl-CoA ligase (AMP-forming), exosortase A system-associated [Parahaliea mediterranea]